MSAMERLSEAIETSIRENRIVELCANGDISSVYADIYGMVDDCEYTELNDRHYDIWGTMDNASFRLCVECSE